MTLSGTILAVLSFASAGMSASYPYYDQGSRGSYPDDYGRNGGSGPLSDRYGRGDYGPPPTQAPQRSQGSDDQVPPWLSRLGRTLRERERKRNQARIVLVPYPLQTMLAGFNPTDLPQLMPIKDQLRYLQDYLINKGRARGSGPGGLEGPPPTQQRGGPTPRKQQNSNWNNPRQQPNPSPPQSPNQNRNQWNNAASPPNQPNQNYNNPPPPNRGYNNPPPPNRNYNNPPPPNQGYNNPPPPNRNYNHPPPPNRNYNNPPPSSPNPSPNQNGTSNDRNRNQQYNQEPNSNRFDSDSLY